MLSSHIALVPETTEVDTDELHQVSSAISVQITRDFGRIWSLDATHRSISLPSQGPPEIGSSASSPAIRSRMPDSIPRTVTSPRRSCDTRRTGGYAPVTRCWRCLPIRSEIVRQLDCIRTDQVERWHFWWKCAIRAKDSATEPISMT